MGDLTGPGGIDEGLMQRAIASDRKEKAAMTEPRFDKAIRDYRETLMSGRLFLASDAGGLAMNDAGFCNVSGVLKNYAKFLQDIKLIGEGSEHLEPNEKTARVKAQIESVIDALDQDIVEALQKNCGCGEKR